MSYEEEKDSKKLGESCKAFIEGLVSFPLNIPGTAFYASLQKEHETILRKRDNENTGITWEEYKSMTFTHMVINEAMRIGNVTPGIFRKVVKDVEMNGKLF
ncbi:hypothetical protein Q3G72_004951 [Acer saccharum]|nr:hypothetical protein Q3G72_004951 [Acer saccharum]